MLPAIVRSFFCGETPSPGSDKSLLPIEELFQALEDFEKGSSHPHRAKLHDALKKVLAKEEYRDHFKNRGWIPWDNYLYELREIMTSLNTQKPVYDEDLAIARSLVSEEVKAAKQTFPQRFLKGAVEMIHGAISSVASQAITAIAIPLPPEPPIHPLKKLESLIDAFEGEKKTQISASKEIQLFECLNELEKRPLFEGVTKHLQGRSLHQQGRSLLTQILHFIVTQKTKTNDQPWDKILQLHGVSHDKLNAFGRSASVQDTQNQDTQKALQNATIEYDSYQKIINLLNLAFTPTINTLEKLNQAIPNALLLFSESPERVVNTEDLAKANSFLKQWLTVALKEGASREEIDSCTEMIDQGQHLKAMQKLQKIVNLRLAQSLTKEQKQAQVAQHHKMLTDATKQLDDIGKAQHQIVQADIDAEKEALVSNLSMFTTFMSVAATFGDDPNHPREAAFDQIMKSFADEKNPDQRRNLFQTRMEEWIDRDSGNFISAWLRKTWAKNFFNRVATPLFSSVTKEVLEFIKKTIYSPVTNPLGCSQFKLVTRTTHAVMAYNQALKEFAGYQGTRSREEFLEEMLRGKKFNLGFEHTELLNKVTELAIDKFVNLPRPFRWVAKRVLTYFDVPTQGLKTMIDQMYKESRYVNVIDGTILAQLKSVEQMLDAVSFGKTHDEGGPVIHESAQGRARFKEFVDNFFIMFERRRCHTPSAMEGALAPAATNFEGVRRNIKDLAETNLEGAMVQLLTFSYQRVLNESMIRFLSHKTMHKLNDTLFPHSKLEELFTQEELKTIALARQKPVRTLTEQDLKDEYAREKGLPNASLVTQKRIDTDLQLKYQQTEIDLKQMVTRFIERGKRMAIQCADDYLKTPEQVSSEYLDWLRTTSSQFAKKTKQLITRIDAENDKQKKEQYEAELKQTLLNWTNEFKSHIGKIREKIGSNDANDAHLLSLTALTSKVTHQQLPHLVKTAESYLQGNKQKTKDLCDALQTIVDTISSMTLQMDALSAEPSARLLSLKSHAVTSLYQIGQNLAPGVISTVTAAASPQIQHHADQILDISKDPVILETAIRHGLLLFVEGQGAGRHKL